MDPSMTIQNQLLATKFFLPTVSGPLIPRSRLITRLDESLKYPLTLVSAPAGFGKTTLLVAWAQSLPAHAPARVAWVSLDQEDNDPYVFWTYVLSALDQQEPERFVSLSMYLQSSPPPPLKYVLMALNNLLLDSSEQYVVILDDYHLITEPQVHATLSSLIEHLAPQLHLILVTRTDLSLPLAQMRARRQVLEIRADQLRCTAQETRDFLQHVVDVALPDKTIQAVTNRTEGWFVGLRLLGLGLQGQPNPAALLLEETSGDQRYILDFLTQEVLGQQPQEVQSFLLSTCILERLTASLCDAVMQQTGSQQMLERLEQANLFVVSLDHKQQWYRYHTLFAEALYYQLKRRRPDLEAELHHRAIEWYVRHEQTTAAILHACKAKAWQWVADLIEGKVMQAMAQTWRVDAHELILLQEWIKQMPAEVVGARPRLCLACAWMLWQVTPHAVMAGWLGAAERSLTASLRAGSLQTPLTAQVRQEQEDLLGEVTYWRAVLRSYQQDGEAALPLCQQAQALLSPDNAIIRSYVALTELLVYYYSAANDAGAALQSGQQAISLAQATGQSTLIINMVGTIARYMIATGQLHQAHQLVQQAMQLEMPAGEPVLPQVCFCMTFQAETLREWNDLDTALALVQEAIALGEQTASVISLLHSLFGYMTLLRISLSRADLDAARYALRQIEQLGTSMEPHFYLFMYSLFTMTDQVKLWLACEEGDHATRWVKELDLRGQQHSPFVHERQEVARARVLLANKEPEEALRRLEFVLQRATIGQRWGHVIEIRLLQALAYQMCQEEMQALDVLSEAIHLAEPEGYVRSFVDEGDSMALLLSRLWEQRRRQGPTSYLDTVLAAFPRQNKAQKHPSKRTRHRASRPNDHRQTS